MTCQTCGAMLRDQAKFCPKCGAKVVSSHSGTPAAFAHDVSKVWPDWRIEKQLGKGSYGTVYQAVRSDHQVESRAAIKVVSIPSDHAEVRALRAEGMNEQSTRSYFRGVVNDFVGEIQVMESLKGAPNIVVVEDYKVVEKTDAIGWDIYIRMELLTPFTAWTSDKTLSEADIIKLGSDMCSALEICNQCRIIHRDIKPENIFINSFGQFKLGDFGIARRLENKTAGLSQKGTFNYMAPEVAHSRTYDARVDIYSLGIVLYRLLNDNRLPFLNTDKQLLSPSERQNAVDRRLRGEPLPPPSRASAEMADVVLRACAYTPDARFATATEMKRALEKVASGHYVLTEHVDETVRVRSAMPDTPMVRQSANDAFAPVPSPSNRGKKVALILTIIATTMMIMLIGVLGLFLFLEHNDWFSLFEDETGETVTTTAPNDDEETVTTTMPSEQPPTTQLQPAGSIHRNGIRSVSASSFLNDPEATIIHEASRVVDGKLDTAWVEGANGSGIGETITFTFDQPYAVSGFTIHSGYHKTEALYYENARPKSLLVTFSDGSQIRCGLQDAFQGQQVSFNRSFTTDSVTIKVESIYSGSKYQDMAISEISLY